MEKRLLLAFILSFAVLYGFRFMMPSPPAVPKAAVENPARRPAAGAPVGPVPAAGGDITVKAETAAEHKIENDLYIATFSNVGGVLESLRLKAYPDAAGEPSEL